VLPLAQTIPQAKALTNEGKLVTIPNVRVASVPGGTGTAFTVLVYVGTDTLQVRVAGALTGLTRSDFVVGDRYSLTGILTQFNGTAQLKPRGDADVASAITTIAAIRTQPIGTVATVSGNITVPPNVFTSGTNGVNSEIWVQDATGGIAVFSVLSAEAANLALGDRVEVTGTLGTFSGQLQLGTPTVTRISSGTEPVPVVQNGTQINARTLEGRVVTLPNFLVTSVPTGTGAAFTVTGTADGQTIQVRIAATQTGLTRANFTVGNTYTVTGVLTQFNGTAQIKPRFRTDVNP
jgi:DNA/RNA endonuclease YhcR with UshA esterase domain